MRGTRAKAERKAGIRTMGARRGNPDARHIPGPQFDHAKERRSCATRWPTEHGNTDPETAHTLLRWLPGFR